MMRHKRTRTRRAAAIAAAAFFALLALAPPTPAHAQQSETYARGTVREVVEEGVEEFGEGFRQPYRVLTVRIDSGPEKGEIVTVTQYGEGLEERGRAYDAGDRVIVGKGDTGGVDEHFIQDAYRLPAVGFIFLVFLVLAIIFAGVRGATSVLGLVFSVGVLAGFVVPRIVAGDDPLVISLIGAAVIALFAVYLAHGFDRKTSIAVASILATLVLAAVFAVLFTSLARLTGLGSEEAFYLQLELGSVNLRGLLLGGMILGALGVLDDVATAQVAAVSEIRNADPKLPLAELYRRGRRVGTAHIASLVNTLALAYIGASLPLFLLFTVNPQLPLWVIANGEIVMEEVVRTIVGSAAVVCAVPISTALAAYVLSRMPPDREATPSHAGHHH